MNLNNRQLLFLGVGSMILLGIGFYNKSLNKDSAPIYFKIEKAYQQINIESHPFEVVLLNDPKMKELTLFYDKSHLGYGERTDQLVHLKPLASYLGKLSMEKNSKINICVKDQEVIYVLQENRPPKVLRGQIKNFKKSSLNEVLLLVLKNL